LGVFAVVVLKQHVFIVLLFSSIQSVNRNRLFNSAVWWNALCLCGTYRESDKRKV